VPINSNLPAANTEKSPKVDDCGTKISFVIDKEIDNPPHVVTGDTVDFPAHYAFDVFIIEHHCGDGILRGRRRRSRFRGRRLWRSRRRRGRLSRRLRIGHCGDVKPTEGDDYAGPDYTRRKISSKIRNSTGNGLRYGAGGTAHAISPG
jgi:hypothetical protein